jgi:hypothetical protein
VVSLWVSVSTWVSIFVDCSLSLICPHELLASYFLGPLSHNLTLKVSLSPFIVQSKTWIVLKNLASQGGTNSLNHLLEIYATLIPYH